MCARCTQQYYYDDDDDNIYVYDCVYVYLSSVRDFPTDIESYFPYVREMKPRRRNTQQATKKEKQFQALIFLGGYGRCVCLCSG